MSSTPERAYVGLGANLGDRHATIRSALDAIGKLAHVELLAVSELRETEPVDVVDQPSFVNGACLVETTLTPRALLEALLAIEERLGRVREVRRGRGPSISISCSLGPRYSMSQVSPSHIHACTNERSY